MGPTGPRDALIAPVGSPAPYVRQASRPWTSLAERAAMPRMIHRDTYTVPLAMTGLAGLIALLLILVNPVR